MTHTHGGTDAPECTTCTDQGPEENCGVRVGRKPWWMGEDQYDPCFCILPKNHDPEEGHYCSHTIDDRLPNYKKPVDLRETMETARRQRRIVGPAACEI